MNTNQTTEYADRFYELLSNTGVLQSKLFEKIKKDYMFDELLGLNQLLKYYIEENKLAIEEVFDCYSFINQMVIEETYYFRKYGKYRNSTFEEVEQAVYANREYMQKYMIGLTITDFIWLQHVKTVRYFKSLLPQLSGNYFEIGPGFGQYLSKAIQFGKFTSFKAIDISDTSVANSNKYLDYLNISDKCRVKKEDFFQYDSNSKFDTIVMGEVLEHVEQPLAMLKKIREILASKGKAFITTVINAPAFDHIFLFNTLEEVLDLCKQAGFKIVEHEYYIANDLPLEKALKKKVAINIAVLLQND